MTVQVLIREPMYRKIYTTGKFGKGFILTVAGINSITGYKGITGGNATNHAAWIKTDQKRCHS